MDSIIGISGRNWLRLLKDNRFRITPSAWLQALVISALAVKNSLLVKKELQQFASEIDKITIDPHPIFVIGHWRSGTTFLHNLLANDTRFSYARLFDVRHPHTFLSQQSLYERVTQGQYNHKRPTDNIMVAPDSPSEEEFGVGILTLQTPLLGWLFPKRQTFYDRYQTFEEVSEQEKEQWKKQYLHFLKKLLFKYRKWLLLKSPINTARLDLLLTLFPDAKFIHIHRNPYHVFQSTKKMYERAVASSSLQGNYRPDLDQEIITNYKIMYDSFLIHKTKIKEGNFVQISYEQLDQDAFTTVSSIYRQLHLQGFEEMKSALSAYIGRLKNYKKNAYKPIDPAIKKQINREWLKYFDAWGYSIED